MDFKKKAKELFDFLMPYEQIWQEEMLDHYPHSLNHYPEELLKSLRSLDDNELWQIDSKKLTNIPHLQNSSLQFFYQRLNDLCDIPMYEVNKNFKYDAWVWDEMKQKKRHEVSALIPIISQLNQKYHFEHLNDIGGGVGHLSRTVAYYSKIPTNVLEREINFIERGKSIIELKKIKRRIPQDAKEIKFEKINFGNQTDEQKLSQLISPRSFTLGLHTCGSLAYKVIETTTHFKTYGLLNFGCCYGKLTSLNDYPVSNFFKQQDHLNFNLFSLTLASRSHAPISFDEFKIKKRVKYYRYALHFLFIEKFNRSDILSVGEVHTREYSKPFSQYALARFEHLNISCPLSKDELESFFQSEKIQGQLFEVFIRNIIRWNLGRALEVYFLLDRAIYLEELGYKVQMNTYFKEEISPRNIGILAIKSES